MTIDWTLMRRQHPYWYGFRAFVARDIEPLQAAYMVVADPEALAEIAQDCPGEFPLTVAQAMVEEVWTPARALLEGFNDEKPQEAQTGWTWPQTALTSALEWVVEDAAITDTELPSGSEEGTPETPGS